MFIMNLNTTRLTIELEQYDTVTIFIRFRETVHFDDKGFTFFNSYLNFFAPFHTEEECWSIKYRYITKVFYKFIVILVNLRIQAVCTDIFVSCLGTHFTQFMTNMFKVCWRQYCTWTNCDWFCTFQDNFL